MENKANDHNIYVKDLIFAALHQWRKVLLVAILAALLLGSFKCVTGIISVKDPEALAQISLQNQIQKDRYEAEKSALALQVSHLLTSIQSQQVYLDSSPLMALDPYNHYEGTLVIYIDSNYKIQPGVTYQSPDYTHAAIAAYSSLLLSEESLDGLSEILNVDPLYLPELIKLGNKEYTNDNLITTSDSLLIVRIKAATQEEAKMLLLAIEQQIKSFHPTINSQIGSHKLQNVERTVTAKVDTELAQIQQTANSQLDELMKDLNAVQEKQALLTLPVTQSDTVGAVLKQAALFAVIGAVAGTMLAAVVIWVHHCSSDRVFSARTLADRTNLKIIGTVAAETNVAKVYQWEGRCTASNEEQYPMLAVNVRNRHTGGTLLLTGNVDPQRREALVQALIAAMPDAAIINAEDIKNSADALEQLSACEAVVLVEECNVSRYENVKQRISLIQDHNKPLLGCILYGG